MDSKATRAAVELNRKRWAKTTKAERSEAARKAALARWAAHAQSKQSTEPEAK